MRKLSTSQVVRVLLCVALVAFAAPSLTAAPQEIDPNSQAKTPSPVLPEADPERFFLRMVDTQGIAVSKQTLQIQMSPKPDDLTIAPGELVREARSGFSVTTDASGQIGFNMPPNTNALSIKFSVPGFGPYLAEWNRSKTGDEIPRVFKAEVERAWLAGGVVVDENDQPVSGVEVGPSITYRKPPDQTRRLGIGTRIFTDEQGRWQFDNVPDSQADVFVEVSHKDYRPHRLRLSRDKFALKTGDQPTAKIVLPAGLTISGTITDADGKPIERALVRTKFMNDIRTAMTNADGNYTLKGCEARRARVVASAAGKAVDMVEVLVEEDMKPVNFQMKPGGHVKIRVVDDEGNGLPRSRIFFQEWRPGRFEYFEFDHVNQYTDANGVWEWNEAPTDGFKADICHPDGMQMSEQELLPREEEYIFQPPPYLVVSGLVIDAETKKLIPEFRVVPGIRGSADDEIDWINDKAFKAKDGRYRFRHLEYAYEAHLVRVDVEGYLPQVSREIQSDEGNVTIHFKLERGVDISTIVQSATGENVVGAEVVLGTAGTQITIQNGRVKSSSTYNAKQTITDDEGRFRFSPEVGAYQIVVLEDQGYAHIKAKPAEELGPITLTPWATVSGVYRIGDDVGANLTIDAYNDQIHEYGSTAPHIMCHFDTVAQQDGRFRFERIPAGRTSVRREIVRMVRDGATEVASTPIKPFVAVSGENSEVQLGGTGVAVYGKLVPPANYKEKIDWKQGSIRVEVDIDMPKQPEIPKEVGDDRDAYRKWWADWIETPAGKTWVIKRTRAEEIRDGSVSFYATIDKDGSFRIDDIPAGQYAMSASSSRQGPRVSDYKVTVTKSQVEVGEPIDLGDVMIQE
ncbi:MAG: carboxypeptidase-like regulatory domain-containing protein [Pirellulaceae bacterium]